MAITTGLFDQYMTDRYSPVGNALEPRDFVNPRIRPAVDPEPTVPEVPITPVVPTTPAPTPDDTDNTLTPRDLLDLAEEGQPATADPVDTVYEGDNRPTYIKERTNITAEQYNQFLSEFDDAVAQAGLDYRQAILQQRIQQEATGGDPNTDRTDAVLQNQQLQNQLFQSAVKDIAAKYGVPMTYTTKGGERWDLNANGKYTRTTEVGGWDDYLKAAVKVAITTVATAGLGSALAAGLGAAGVPTNVANVIADVVVGAAQGDGDIKQGIINAFAPVPDELRQVTDYFPDGLDGIVDIARSVYDTANAETQPDVTTDFEVNIDPEQTDPITVDEDTGDVTVGLPEPTLETPTETAGGGGGGATETPSEVVTEPPTVTDTTTAADGDFWETATTDESVVARQIWEVYQGILNGTLEGNPEDILKEYEVYTGSTEPPPESTEQTGTATGTTEQTSGGDTTQDVTLEDLLGNVGTVFEDTTADVPVEPTPEPPATVEPPPAVIEPTVPTTSVEKTTETTPTDTRTPTLPDETGDVDTGDAGVDTTTTDGTDGGTDTGTGTGDGAGDGTGTGDGAGDGTGDGIGDGRGTGIGYGMFGGSASPITTQPYMGSITFAPQMLTPIMPKQSIDYLAELIARLQR